MGRVHTIMAEENKEYLQSLAGYIDSKLREVTAHPSFKRCHLKTNNYSLIQSGRRLY